MLGTSTPLFTLLLAFLGIFLATGKMDFTELATMARDGSLNAALSTKLGWSLFGHDFFAGAMPRIVFLGALLGFAFKPLARDARNWASSVQCAFRFNSYVALAVEIGLDSAGRIKVTKAQYVIDCGVVINPNAVEAQMQGGLAHGIYSALYNRVTFVNGVPQVQNFSNYRVLRPRDMPKVSPTTPVQ